MNKGLISIIVPVYNCEDYITKCLNSIINQTYSNFEILIVDDGSRDNTSQICKNYIENNKEYKIKYIYQCNQGPAVARNRGLRESRGEYITFVDADDYIDKNYIFVLYNLILENKAEVSICQTKRFGEKVSTQKIFHKKSIVISQKKAIKKLFRKEGILPSPWGKMFCREVVNGLIFPENLFLGEDMSFLYYVLCQCRRIAVGKNKLYFYRLNNTSITHTIKPEEAKDCWIYFYKLMEIMDKEYINSLRARLLVFAYDILSRGSYTEDFKPQLIEYIKDNSFRVFRDYENKMIVRFLGILGLVSIKWTVNICKVFRGTNRGL